MNWAACSTIIIALIAGSAQSVSAQSRQELQALKSAAWAQVIAHRCDRYSVNWGRVGLVLATVGITAEDIDPAGRRGKEFGAQLRGALDTMKNQDETTICMTGMVLYGPSGRNIPGGLELK